MDESEVQSEEQKNARRKAIVDDFFEINSLRNPDEDDQIVILEEMRKEFIESAKKNWNYVYEGPFGWNNEDQYFENCRSKAGDIRFDSSDIMRALEILRREGIDEVLKSYREEGREDRIQAIVSDAQREYRGGTTIDDFIWDDVAKAVFESKEAIRWSRRYLKEIARVNEVELPDEYAVEYAKRIMEKGENKVPFVNAMSATANPKVKAEQKVNERNGERKYDAANNQFVDLLNQEGNTLVYYYKDYDVNDYYNLAYVISSPDENGVTKILAEMPVPVLFEKYPQGYETVLPDGKKLKDKISLFVEEGLNSTEYPDISEFLSSIFDPSERPYAKIDIIGDRFEPNRDDVFPGFIEEGLGDSIIHDVRYTSKFEGPGGDKLLEAVLDGADTESAKKYDDSLPVTDRRKGITSKETKNAKIDLDTIEKAEAAHERDMQREAHRREYDH